jgi:hypothetical protein
VTSLAYYEVDRSQRDTLFRANSLSTKALDLFMRLYAHDYLVTCVLPAVHLAYAEKRSCELDPSKLRKGVQFSVLSELAYVLNAVCPRACRRKAGRQHC